jgi:ankyrin repeat protein
MSELDDALWSANLDALRELIRADPDARLDDGRRPLSVAAGLGDATMIALLVAAGAPIDARDDTKLGYTALITAAREDQAASVRQLLDLGADLHAGDSIDGTALHQTGVAGLAEVALVLLDAGAPVDAVDRAGTTPLIRVAQQADAAIHWSQDEDGNRTRLPHPLHQRHLDTAELLLLKGADADHLGHDGYAPLHHAATNGATDLAARLLAAGATVNLQNGIGYAPLHAACDSSQVAMVRALLAAGADPDLADNLGFVALHGAACQGSAEVARLLLAAGADRGRRTSGGYDKVTAGMTPAQAAEAYGHDAVADLLG